VLEALAAAPEVTLVAVVTAMPRPAGRAAKVRPTPVGERASSLGVPILTPSRPRDPAFVAQLAALHPALGILADYGKLLPPAILEIPARGILNLHPSLLPRHRGATPVPAAIIEGDAETGVTLFRMDAGMDTGPIVASEKIDVPGGADAPWLGGTLAAVAQAADGISVTRPLRRDDGRLDATRPAAELERKVRALRPWPGTFVEAAGGRIVVLRVAVAPSRAGDEPGWLVDDGVAGPALATSSGRLRLLEVQPAGGRPMAGAALVRGRPRLIGTRVG
jgi:methionyl-tRNA formyltransferase